MSDSDTSNEENLDLLREAADTQFINDSMFTSVGSDDNYKEYNGRNKQVKPMSLRPQLNNKREYNELNVTPEFQNFIAKHLDKIVDRQLIEFCGGSSPMLLQNENSSNQPSAGVRLFGCSSNYLCAELVPFYKENKRRVCQEEDADELKKCESVAVSPEWIVSGKGTSGWEKNSEGELLVVNANGDVIDHRRTKKKIKTNSWGVRKNTFHIDVTSEDTRTHKNSEAEEKL